MEPLLDLPLLHGLLPWLLTGAGALGAALLLARRGRGWWTRRVPAVLGVAAVVAALAAVVVDRVWRPFPDPLPAAVVASTGVAAAAVGLVVAGFRTRRRRGRAASVLAAALVVVASAQSVNGYYREFPTVRTLLGLPAVDQVEFAAVPRLEVLVPARPGRPFEAAWRAPAGLPATGVIAQVDIPGTESRFAARPGWVYLPPAYLTSPRAQLPVLVLLAGQPGSPRDWVAGGGLAETMDAYAAAHDGLAPIVVMPDDLGSPLANPLCLDSRLGNVATYLSRDVPGWVRATLQADRNPRSWAIGGLSSGGTCALQMAVNVPEVYPTVVDISGQAEPTLGDRATTVRAAFGGDDAAFAAVAPLDVLARTDLPDTAAYLVAGSADTVYRPQAERVLAALHAAGVDATLQVLPGGHTWEVWRPGLAAAVPWLGTRLGLTG